MNKKEWTIKELADYCGTSKTSINRVIKELEIEPTVQGNKNIIDYEDADRIVLFCRGFGLNCAENETNQTTANQNETNQTNSSKTENVENTDFSSSSIVFENSKNDNDFFVKFLMEQIIYNIIIILLNSGISIGDTFKKTFYIMNNPYEATCKTAISN